MLHYFTRISHIVCVFILKNANELQSTFYFHFVKYLVGLTHQTCNFQLDLILLFRLRIAEVGSDLTCAILESCRSTYRAVLQTKSSNLRPHLSR